MKAVLFREHGGPDVLELVDVPTPEPGPGQVLVRVHAVSINRTLDGQLRQGTSEMNIQLPFIPGIDPSGVVESIGPGVEHFKPGDRVTGSVGPPPSGGGYAEFVCLKEDGLYSVPEGVDFGSATVAQRHFPTAYSLCRTSALQSGETVLVMGATGGLASCAVQLAKSMGCTVIAGAGADDRVAAAISLGADYGVNYRRQNLQAEVMRITGGKGVQVVFENIGDPSMWPGAFGSLATNGRLVTVGSHGADDNIVPLDVRALYRRRLSVMSGLGRERPEDMAEALQALAEGTFTMLIHTVLPLGSAAEAHRLIQANNTLGKIILDPTVV